MLQKATKPDRSYWKIAQKGQRRSLMACIATTTSEARKAETVTSSWKAWGERESSPFYAFYPSSLGFLDSICFGAGVPCSWRLNCTSWQLAHLLLQLRTLCLHLIDIRWLSHVVMVNWEKNVHYVLHVKHEGSYIWVQDQELMSHPSI